MMVRGNVKIVHFVLPAKAINVQGYSRGEIIKKQSIPEQNRPRVTTMFADRSATRNADAIS